MAHVPSYSVSYQTQRKSVGKPYVSSCTQKGLVTCRPALVSQSHFTFLLQCKMQTCLTSKRSGYLHTQLLTRDNLSQANTGAQSKSACTCSKSKNLVTRLDGSPILAIVLSILANQLLNTLSWGQPDVSSMTSLLSRVEAWRTRKVRALSIRLLKTSGKLCPH